MPSVRTWQVRVGADETTATWDPASDDGRDGRVVICAHGAGGHMNDRLMLATRDALTERGIGMVRFNFMYRARGSTRPDPMPRLLECFAEVIRQVQPDINSQVLILGGRSMGGRAASVLVSRGAACAGLLLLAYPLHPPGRPDRLRDAHLSGIRAPVLCINGTRDAFCERTVMEQVLVGLGPNWRMCWIDDADHGFHVLKRSGQTDRDVLAQIAGEADAWSAGLRG